MSDSDHPRPEIKPVKTFIWVFVALLALLALTVGSALLKLGPFNTVINLLVSVISMLLLMTFFMHETAARKLTQVVSAVGFIWIAIMIGLTLVDFLTRARVPAPWW